MQYKKRHTAMQCTVYIKSIRSRKERTSALGLGELIKELQADGKRKMTVEALRREVSDLPPSLHWRNIDLLPRVCVAQETLRKRNGVIQNKYNGVVMLDVGNIDSLREADEVKGKAAAWPTTLATFVGSSGRSVKILVSGAYDDGSLPTDEDAAAVFHKALYLETARVYATLLQRPLRTRKAEPTESFRWTYDPTAFFNADAMPVRISLRNARTDNTSANLAAHVYAPTSNVPTPENNKNARRRFATAFAQADEKIGDEQLTQEEELNIVAAEAFTLGLPLEETIRQAIVSMHWHDMGREAIRATIESIYLEKGAPDKSKHSRSMQELSAQLQTFMTTHYDLRFNELTNGVEWRTNNSASYTFEPLDSRVMNTMIQACHENGIEVFDRDMKRYLGSTRVRNYNAAQAYLKEVRGCWDGHTDYIGALADRVPCRNPHWKEWFHTWFLGMVAQWDGWNTIYGNATVPLLIGAQGCGKSTFGQLLLPPELRETGYRELVDFTSKQDAERMTAFSLLINLDEFNQISEKTQQGFLKNLIQKSSIKGRRPYSSTTQTMPRYASFIATTNFPDVLSDPSGSRRFLVADVRNGSVINNKPPFYYDKVYAQALSELENGRRHYFTADEVNEIEQYNAQFTSMRVEISTFLDVFEPLAEWEEGAKKMKVSDIAKAVSRHTGYTYSEGGLRMLGRWLTSEAKAGRVKKSASNGTAVYVVRENF